jgi:NAD(P)-dependent dehydrogenase (short-subunit alcohol dehydrogenase family)
MGSSTGGWDVLYGAGAYMASKEGIEGITKNMALEAAAYGVRVNAVCPGVIRTHLSYAQSGSEDNSGSEDFYARFEKRIPLRRVGQPEDVAGAVLFFASDLARHITGTTLLIDGGQTLQSWSNAPDADEYPHYVER